MSIQSLTDQQLALTKQISERHRDYYFKFLNRTRDLGWDKHERLVLFARRLWSIASDIAYECYEEQQRRKAPSPAPLPRNEIDTPY